MQIPCSQLHKLPFEFHTYTHPCIRNWKQKYSQKLRRQNSLTDLGTNNSINPTAYLLCFDCGKPKAEISSVNLLACDVTRRDSALSCGKKMAALID